MNQNASTSAISRLMQVAKPYRNLLYVGLACVVISTLFDTAIITFLFTAMIFAVLGKTAAIERGFKLEIGQFNLGDLMQRLTGHTEKLPMLIALAGITAVAVLIKCIADSRQGYLMNRFASRVAWDLRQRLFNQLLRLSPSYFEREATGSHVSRITGDVVVLQQCLGPQLVEVVHAPLTILFSLGLMFAISWQLTLTALCLAPVIAVVMAIGGRQIRKLSVRIQDRLAELNAGLVERLGNVRIIQSFVREPHESERVSELNQSYFRDTMRSVQVAEIISPGVEFIAYIGMICGIIVGGWGVLSGHMNVGIFVYFLLLAQKGGSQFKRLSRVNQVRQQANGAGLRIFALLDTEPEIKDCPDARELQRADGRVTFENVSFHYSSSSEPVLQDIALDVQPGEVIALVGPSGAGKTTMVNLLPRFYDPTAGRILLDGIDLRDLTLASLRGQIGIVPQETALFSGTIHENIRYGKLDASDDELIEAARAANALEFIERLPEGFDTVVGERGTRLSGGQRQRVAIARAILKNPRILILDEATSALDTESEHLVQQALERLMESRTTFVIAHRLSTVQHADRILVLDRGRIVEAGSHTELLAQGGLYQRLYEMQFRKRTMAEPLEGV